MISERIFLNEKKSAWFDTYIISNSKELLPDKKRAAVVVCPGGGYTYTSDREAEPVALLFNSMGYHAFVLRYSVGSDALLPQPMKELAMTVAEIKNSSDEWFVDPDKVFVSGFSAGAHVAAGLGVFWNNEKILPEFSKNRELIRPAGMILGYPVIDLKSTSKELDIGIKGYPDYDTIEFDHTHPKIKPEDIFIRKDGKTLIDFEIAMNSYMFDGYASYEQIYQYSLENHVSADTPPAFIWHGGEDNLIYPSNSMMFANALMQNKVPVELHIFGTGGHGLGLANDVTSNYPWEKNDQCMEWTNLAKKWMQVMTTK